MPTPRLTPVALALLAALVAPGCARYVNIPPQRGDVARSNVDASAIRKITIPAVRAVVADAPPPGLYVVQLPRSDDNLTYPAILPAIGDNAIAPFDEARGPDTPVYEVTGIRTRGRRGEVDVVRPIEFGGRQLVTVYLKNPTFGTWTFDRLRPWRGAVDQAPPPPPAAAIPLPEPPPDASSQADPGVEAAPAGEAVPDTP